MKITKQSIPALLIATFSIILAIYYISAEQNVYYWDYNGYWRFWQNFSLDFSQHPLHSFSDIFHSIRYDDYNILPVVVTAIFNLLPLGSRLAYILSNVIVYLIPSLFLFSSLCRRFGHYDNLSDKALVLTLAGTFAAFWAPTLSGYPDICGLIAIIGSVLYCINFDMGAKRQFKKALVLGFLLWAPFLLRRWYAYTVVTLYVSLPVLNYLLFAKDDYGRKRIQNIVVNFFIAGIFSCLLAVICQGPLLVRIISTNYAYIYSAYQSSFQYSVDSLINHVGVYLLPFVIFGLLSSFAGVSKRPLIFILFCLFNLLFSFFLFTRTQSPGIQHIIPFALWGLLVAGQGLLWLMGKLKSSGAKWTMVAIVALVTLSIQMHSLFDMKVPNFVAGVMPTKTLPLRVQNYPAYITLSSEIQRLTAHGDKVTVLSSNNVLNDDMLNTLSDRRLEGRISYTSQVDLRDGINFEALKSRYFIVTDPVQIHLSADGQRVIVIPTEALLSHQNIGQAFIRLDPEYKLSNKVSAWIYERTRPYTQQEIDDYLNSFYRYYPEWKAAYGNGSHLLP